jgi:hypothetical protein
VTMFTKIEEVHLPDHHYLTDEDLCYFYGEYTPRQNYGYSETNGFILNLKKSMDRRGLPEWRYKEQAILKATSYLQKGFPPEWLRSVTFIPVPPSKMKGDPLYDDRLVRILKNLQRHFQIDIRELIVQNVSRETMHLTENRYTPDQLKSMYSVDQGLVLPAPSTIAIFDDMLTSGTHFKAISSILSNLYPNIPIYGIFLARRIFPAVSFDF